MTDYCSVEHIRDNAPRGIRLGTHQWLVLEMQTDVEPIQALTKGLEAFVPESLWHRRETLWRSKLEVL